MSAPPAFLSGLSPRTSDDESSAASPWLGGSRYERLRCIGRGGHGVVYEVFDHLRKRRVALKTLVQSTPASLFSFKQEFRTLAGLRHPNLVHLHELVSAAEGAEFFTMELVSGEDFRHHTRSMPSRSSSPLTLPITPTRTELPVPAPRIALPRPFSPPNVVHTSPVKLPALRAALPQLVAGLRALHAAGKLHRDIKASNVMVSTEGRVVILDFGLSTGVSHREAAEDMVSGTPEYMAPEQVLNEPLQPASDWYAVGVLLFDALVGRPPFQGTVRDILQQKLLLDCPRPSQLVAGVPDDLDELCVRLLAKNPDARPSGKELAQLLGGEGRPHSGRPSHFPTTLVGRQREVEALERALAEARERGPAAVLLHGPSGIGKSTLLSHFAESVRREGRATVLSSRVYEQESIPFKAVDELLDSLSQKLEMWQREGRDLPPDPSFRALGRLFPVLRRTPAFDFDGDDGPADPLRTRERAFQGLRLLLSHVTRDQPMVWILDDVQWGDLDSAALLSDLLAKAGNLPLLLVLSHRNLGGQANAFLDGLSQHWPAAVSRTDLPIAALSQVDIRELLMGARVAGEVADGLVEQVFQISTGNAFLASELAHALLPNAASPTARVAISGSAGGSLETRLLDDRLRGLDVTAVHLLEMVAASGRALRTETAASAAGLESGVDGAVSALSQRRLVSSVHQSGLEMLEVRHDRIREWVLSRLSETELRQRHRRLAETLEATPNVDADLWIEHWLRSGDSAQVCRVALAAAVRAAERLALKRAETLYRVALGHVDGGAEQELSIHRALARVLEWDGRGADAAQSYLRAAELTSGAERSALQSAAGMRLIYAGSFAQGADLLRASLRELDLPAPTTRLGALASLVFGRFRLSNLESKLSPRPGHGASEVGQARVEVLHAAAFGFVFTDPLLGECLQAAHLAAALDQGTAQQTARALALEASQRAHRSLKGAESAERLFERAEQMAHGSDEAVYREFVQACRGVSQFLCGNWRTAHALLGEAYASVPRHTAGWHTTAWIYDVFALCNQGRFDLVAQRLPGLLQAAEARGDRFTATTLRVSANVPLLLARNDPAAARVELREGMGIWDQPAFLVQHWRAMWWGAETDLYEGLAGAARQRCLSDAPRLKRSFLLRVQYIRCMTLFLRARVALATFDEDPKSRTRELLALKDQLTSEGRSWTRVLAGMVAAGLALRTGRSELGVQELRSAIELATQADMAGHAQACRLLLGARLGAAEGRELGRSAAEELTRNGVSEPERYAHSLLPV